MKKTAIRIASLLLAMVLLVSNSAIFLQADAISSSKKKDRIVQLPQRKRRMKPG